MIANIWPEKNWPVIQVIVYSFDKWMICSFNSDVGDAHFKSGFPAFDPTTPGHVNNCTKGLTFQPVEEKRLFGKIRIGP